MLTPREQLVATILQRGHWTQWHVQSSYLWNFLWTSRNSRWTILKITVLCLTTSGQKKTLLSSRHNDMRSRYFHIFCGKVFWKSYSHQSQYHRVKGAHVLHDCDPWIQKVSLCVPRIHLFKGKTALSIDFVQTRAIRRFHFKDINAYTISSSKMVEVQCPSVPRLFYLVKVSPTFPAALF